MPTSTFPRWWSEETILELLNAAREGSPYQDLDEIVRQRTGSSRLGKLRAWVMAWKDQPQDRPQARLASAIAAYDPPSSRESSAMNMVESALALHRASCECGSRKDDPDDPMCRNCSLLEYADER